MTNKIVLIKALVQTKHNDSTNCPYFENDYSECDEDEQSEQNCICETKNKEI